MKAIGDNLIITPMEQGVKKTKGGLLLTHGQREDIRFEKAQVLTFGDDVKGINEGDEIYFDSRAGHKIEINKDTYHVIKSRDVVVVL
ncbi:MAG: co-chaperone GroES [Alteromonadales bacterium]|nr:co-chaperone GroES [Alteromonadales bacterium]